MSAMERAIGASRRRGQRGFASLRVLIALTASSVVTVGVAVPMGYQAYQANQTDEAPAEQLPADSATTTAGDRRPPPQVAGETLPEVPSLALPSQTTERPTTTAATPTTTAGRPATPTPTTGPAPQPPGPPPTAAPTSGLQATTSTTAPATTTTAPPVTDDGLAWSPVTGLQDLRRLQSATLSGRAWIYFDRNPSTVVEVRFWLDDPTGAGTPVNVERQFPFSLVPGPTNGQPAPLDTTTLADGTHSVRAEVRRGEGVEVRLATFTVDNG